MLPCFQMLEIWQWALDVVAVVCEDLYSVWTEVFEMKVIESGPVAGEFLILLIMCLVFSRHCHSGNVCVCYCLLCM